MHMMLDGDVFRSPTDDLRNMADRLMSSCQRAEKARCDLGNCFSSRDEITARHEEQLAALFEKQRRAQDLVYEAGERLYHFAAEYQAMIDNFIKEP